MKILSLDTSYSTFNFSILEEGEVVFLFIEEGKKTLELLPRVFEELKINFEEFDAFCVCRGVGYSTPLRIGITFLKTVSYTLKRPLLSYTNFEVFRRLDERATPLLKVSHYWLSEEEGKVKILKEFEKDRTYITLERFELPKGLRLITYKLLPFSYQGAYICYEKLRRGEVEDPLTLEPLYFKGL